MDFEKEQFYHLETAKHYSDMGSTKRANTHTEASYLAMLVTQKRANEKVYTEFLKTNNVRGYAKATI